LLLLALLSTRVAFVNPVGFMSEARNSAQCCFFQVEGGGQSRVCAGKATQAKADIFIFPLKQG